MDEVLEEQEREVPAGMGTEASSQQARKRSRGTDAGASSPGRAGNRDAGDDAKRSRAVAVGAVAAGAPEPRSAKTFMYAMRVASAVRSIDDELHFRGRGDSKEWAQFVGSRRKNIGSFLDLESIKAFRLAAGRDPCGEKLLFGNSVVSWKLVAPAMSKPHLLDMVVGRILDGEWRVVNVDAGVEHEAPNYDMLSLNAVCSVVLERMKMRPASRNAKVVPTALCGRCAFRVSLSPLMRSVRKVMDTGTFINEPVLPETILGALSAACEGHHSGQYSGPFVPGQGPFSFSSVKVDSVMNIQVPSFRNLRVLWMGSHGNTCIDFSPLVSLKHLNADTPDLTTLCGSNLVSLAIRTRFRRVVFSQTTRFPALRYLSIHSSGTNWVEVSGLLPENIPNGLDVLYTGHGVENVSLTSQSIPVAVRHHATLVCGTPDAHNNPVLPVDTSRYIGCVHLKSEYMAGRRPDQLICGHIVGNVVNLPRCGYGGMGSPCRPGPWFVHTLDLKMGENQHVLTNELLEEAGRTGKLRRLRIADVYMKGGYQLTIPEGVEELAIEVSYSSHIGYICHRSERPIRHLCVYTSSDACRLRLSVVPLFMTVCSDTRRGFMKMYEVACHTKFEAFVADNFSGVVHLAKVTDCLYTRWLEISNGMMS